MSRSRSSLNHLSTVAVQSQTFDSTLTPSPSALESRLSQDKIFRKAFCSQLGLLCCLQAEFTVTLSTDKTALLFLLVPQPSGGNGVCCSKVHTLTHTYTYTGSQMLSRFHTHTHARTHTHSYTYTLTHTHSYTHSNTHSTHAHRNARYTLTHSHTYTILASLSLTFCLSPVGFTFPSSPLLDVVCSWHQVIRSETETHRAKHTLQQVKHTEHNLKTVATYC